jgi:hypothetical protein
MTPELQTVMLTQILQNQKDFENGKALAILNIEGKVAERYDIVIKMTVELKPVESVVALPLVTSNGNAQKAKV